jgi:hypothetical protein
VLFFLSLLVAFFSWFFISRAIIVPDSSVWLVPLFWLSLFYLVYSLEFILVKEKLLINLSIALGVFSSLIFTPNFWHFLVLLFSAMLLSVSYLQIKKDLRLNVEIHLPKTLRMGKTAFVLALAFSISSQYFFQARSAGLAKLPVFDAGTVLDNKFSKAVLYEINPDLQKLEDKDLTVDQFTLQNFEESQIGSNDEQLLDLAADSRVISSVNVQKIEELRKQKILEAGREQLGKMANQELTGAEKVADVMRESINYQIQNIVSPDYSKDKFPAIPIGMALILFLTILSLGAFIVRILVHLASFIFWIFLSGKIVSIKKVPVEMEVIE